VALDLEIQISDFQLILYHPGNSTFTLRIRGMADIFAGIRINSPIVAIPFLLLISGLFAF
jgi:hypothetical protein